jgi:DNA-binding Xre family transcriptional regulator
LKEILTKNSYESLKKQALSLVVTYLFTEECSYELLVDAIPVEALTFETFMSDAYIPFKNYMLHTDDAIHRIQGAIDEHFSKGDAKNVNAKIYLAIYKLYIEMGVHEKVECAQKILKTCADALIISHGSVDRLFDISLHNNSLTSSEVALFLEALTPLNDTIPYSKRTSDVKDNYLNKLTEKIVESSSADRFNEIITDVTKYYINNATGGEGILEYLFKHLWTDKNKSVDRIAEIYGYHSNNYSNVKMESIFFQRFRSICEELDGAILLEEMNISQTENLDKLTEKLCNIIKKFDATSGVWSADMKGYAEKLKTLLPKIKAENDRRVNVDDNIEALKEFRVNYEIKKISQLSKDNVAKLLNNHINRSLITPCDATDPSFLDCASKNVRDFLNNSNTSTENNKINICKELSQLAENPKLDSTKKKPADEITDQDPLKRKKAVKELNDSADLFNVVMKNNEDLDIRLLALVRLSNSNHLTDVAKNAESLLICRAAFEKLTGTEFLDVVIKHNEKFMEPLVKIENSSDPGFFGNRKYDQALREYKQSNDTPQTKDRYAVYAAVNISTNQKALAYVAMYCEDGFIRFQAVKKLDDQDALAAVSLYDADDQIRKTAVEKLKSSPLLACVAIEAADSLVAETAVKLLTDKKLLVYVAKNASSTLVRKAAIKETTDKTTLMEIVNFDKDISVREEANKRLRKL